MKDYQTKAAPAATKDNVLVYCAHDDIVALAGLVPNPRNPNQHPERQIEQLGSIIEVQGWRAPITVSTRSGYIVRGHGRYLAAARKGWTQAPVDYQEYATEAEEWADLIADNRLAELSSMDSMMMAEMFGDIDPAVFPVEMTGYSTEEFRDILNLLDDRQAEEDGFEVDPATLEEWEPFSKEGDIYILDGKHRLMCGNSTDSGSVDALMDGKAAQLCITDPPYNVDYEGKTKDALKIENDDMSDDAFRDFLTDAFTRMYEVSEPGAAAYVFHADSEGLNFRLAFAAAGYTLKQCLIWEKNVFVVGRQDYQWQHEPILYGWKDGAAHYFVDERTHSTILHENKPLRNEVHPTMKPVPLVGLLVRNSNKPEWLVLDLFAGSGSTLIACEQLNRICYLMELDPRYCDVIVKRYIALKQEQDQEVDVVLLRDGEKLAYPFDAAG
jgi:DNA modification methylase